MKTKLAILVSLLLAAGAVSAEDTDTKKQEKAKSSKKAEKKSDKNAAQKAESDLTDWANRNKIWMHSGKKSDK